ncbi:hypothetical protein MAPG_07818 [Magnaporthiopsis poae ATCC 64411]|uniref:Uncharacterized protein n=1 Tax=Magnaporthiopsis poae (strain ATCC 64411 / 73-15) TaxID=644358 RepID=A0A0C4E5P4_MAGP6|nr:hypothetical protein MAPG_07818 [Magnaporthiopsis poae ATCC 64411]
MGGLFALLPDETCAKITRLSSGFPPPPPVQAAAGETRMTRRNTVDFLKKQVSVMQNPRALCLVSRGVNKLATARPLRSPAGLLPCRRMHSSRFPSLRPPADATPAARAAVETLGDPHNAKCFALVVAVLPRRREPLTLMPPDCRGQYGHYNVDEVLRGGPALHLPLDGGRDAMALRSLRRRQGGKAKKWTET